MKGRTVMLPMIAGAVRLAAERRSTLWRPNRTLRNRCLATSFALHFLLRGAGVSSRLVKGCWLRSGAGVSGVGYRHVRVELDGLIVDLSLTQFKRSAPRVAFLRADDLHYKAEGEIAEGEAVADFFINGTYDVIMDLVLRAVDYLPEVDVAAGVAGEGSEG